MGDGFTFDCFAKTYVEVALKLAERGISLVDFDSGIRKHFDEEYGIPPKVVLHFHHPFHWAFFLTNNEVNSPFRYVHPINEPRGSIRVELGREISPEDVSRLTEYVLEKYGDYLESRIDKFQCREGVRFFEEKP